MKCRKNDDQHRHRTNGAKGAKRAAEPKVFDSETAITRLKILLDSYCEEEQPYADNA